MRLAQSARYRSAVIAGAITALLLLLFTVACGGAASSSPSSPGSPSQPGAPSGQQFLVGQFSPERLSIVRGNHDTATVTTTVDSGFNGPVTLTASGVPSGVTVSFDPPTIPAPGSGTAVMAVAVTGTASTGSYVISVTGNSGGQQHTKTIPLAVVARVSVSWEASPSNGVVGYNLYRAPTQDGPYAILNSDLISGTNYLDPTVASATTYYYVATSVDAEGRQSGYSNVAVAEVP